jgi:hypothetical protein
MTESSKDKTKRNLIKAMEQYRPTYYTSLFFNDYSQRIESLSVFSKIRTPLSRIYPDITFIFYLRTCGGRTNRIHNVPKNKLNTAKIWIPQIQVFTTDKIDEESVEDILARTNYEHLDINVSQQKTKLLNTSWIRTVKIQEPQNLQDYFSLPRSPRRFNITNKKATELAIKEQEVYVGIF